MIEKFLATTGTVRASKLLLLVLLVLFLVVVHPVGVHPVGVHPVGVHQYTAVAAGDSVTAAFQAMLSVSCPVKFLYGTSEAKKALGCGTTKLYDLINSGILEARRLGRKTYITAESLEAFVASLPPVVTPTMAKAEHDRWSGARRRPQPKPQEDEPGAAE
jgi:excisionase family DNA binding protein